MKGKTVQRRPKLPSEVPKNAIQPVIFLERHQLHGTENPWLSLCKEACLLGSTGNFSGNGTIHAFSPLDVTLALSPSVRLVPETGRGE